MNINYSFIVPHHNSPELLRRCIESIPHRDDIEIIVVDDNSDPDKIPRKLPSGIQLIRIGKNLSKGSGRARNYGLSVAVGKWILFADCDDFYEHNFIDQLDKYKDTDAEMVFFDVYYAYDINTGRERWKNKYSEAIQKYTNSGNNLYWMRTLKHIIQGPWNFMVRHDILCKLGATFEEVPKGNDARFHHIVSMNCHNVMVINKKLYYWTWTSNSLTHKIVSKKQRMADLDRLRFISNLRIQAQAWNTIQPFFKGIRG